MFLNLVRVRNDEPTYFLDVSEVDAAIAAQASLTGSLNGSGQNSNGVAPTDKSGTLGAFGGVLGTTLQYQEAPIIRYQPLLGQPLVQQIAAPMTVDSIANLYDSEWPLSTILAFTADRLTPGYETFASAFNAIIELYDYGALTIAAGHSAIASAGPEPSRAAKGAAMTAVTPPTGPNDTLLLYLQTDNPGLHGASQPISAKKHVLRLWARLLEIYQGTQPENPKVSFPDLDAAIASITDEKSFAKVFALLPNNRIELRTSPISAAAAGAKIAFHNLAPVLRTRSALGALKWTIQQWPPYIDFVPRSEYDAIRSQCWNQGTKDFYVLPPALQRDAATGGTNSAVKQTIADWLTNMPGKLQCKAEYKRDDINLGTVNYEENLSSNQDIGIEKELNELRRYILVIESETEPTDAYVAQLDQRSGKWLSIDRADTVSRRNFEFLMQLLTMQAVAPGPPLTPTLSVGGRGG